VNYKDKELIIFDLDGTLIDSNPDLTLAVNLMLSHYDIAPLTVEDTTPFIGNGAKLLVERALNHTMQPEDITKERFDEAFQIFFAAYRENLCVDTYLYPGVLETLEYLDKKGYKMTICTNKPFEFIEPILKDLSIKHYFTSWVGADSVSKQKPDPAPLFHLAKEMNKTIDKCIMVGDSKNDIKAARNADMVSIGVSYGYNYNQHISDFNPDRVIDNFAELQKLF
jgi:phosphoglycolate phosphatase